MSLQCPRCSEVALGANYRRSSLQPAPRPWGDAGGGFVPTLLSSSPDTVQPCEASGDGAHLGSLLLP